MSQSINEQLMEAFEFRHATKEFDPEKKISNEDFHTILESARLSPSSVGLEPWKFVVIQNPALREKLKPVSWGAQKQLPTASHFVAILARKNGRYDSDYFWNQMTKTKGIPEDTTKKMLERYESFQGEDFNLFESDRALFDWSSKQTYIALANMMTTAALLGIDSCPVEGFHQEKVNDIFREEGLLEDDQYRVSVMVAFGTRVKEPRPKTRRETSEVIEWIE